jgi:hypothetical protein
MIGFTQWTLDVHDVDRMLAFWSAALGFTVLADPEDNEFCLIHRPWRRD